MAVFREEVMVDYSKWEKIEVSDDEDDTHPNIDTASLFRWRHQARIERMQVLETRKNEITTKKKEAQEEFNRIKEKFNVDASLKEKYDSAKQKLDDIIAEENKLLKEEKSQPKNVDTLSKPGFDKVMINSKSSNEPSTAQLSEEEELKKSQEFTNKYKSEIKQYGTLRNHADSIHFLQSHSHLVCDYTANYLCIWCIDLAVDKNLELLDKVSYQAVCLQLILELAKQFNVVPQAVFQGFFSRLSNPQPDYYENFNERLKDFKIRVHKCADLRFEKAIKETEEEERKKRLGPEGLDPVEVFETLPKCLQECFQSKNIELLKETLKTMDEKEALYHMKRCVGSGLWVPDASVNPGDEEEYDNPE